MRRRVNGTDVGMEHRKKGGDSSLAARATCSTALTGEDASCYMGVVVELKCAPRFSRTEVLTSPRAVSSC